MHVVHFTPVDPPSFSLYTPNICAASWRIHTPEDRQNLKDLTEVLIKIKKILGKPVAVVLRSCQSQSWQVFLEEQSGYLEGGIPVYLTLEDAANAVSKLIQYYEFREKVT